MEAHSSFRDRVEAVARGCCPIRPARMLIPRARTVALKKNAHGSPDPRLD
jgi:hypothetical protein